MAIRVTSNMMSTQLLSNLNKSLYDMNKISNQVSTGRKINKPSDDPVGTTYALQYRSDLSSNEQYQSNVDSALSWLDYTDSVMDQAGEIMTKLKELVTQGSTGTMEGTDLDAIKEEVEELKEQLVDLGNSQLGGKYIFNGEAYNNKPYELTATNTTYASIDTDDGAVEYSLAVGSELQANTTGSEFFGSSTDDDNAFQVMDNIIAALTSRDQDALNAELDNVESRTETMLSCRAEVGARTNRAELVQNRLDDEELNVTTMLANTEDADVDELLIKSTTAQTIYQSALSAAANMMSMSLVDFMS